MSLTRQNPAVRNVQVPWFVRPPNQQWGSTGQTYSAYLASLADVDDLSSVRILYIDNTADLLHEVVEGRTVPGSLVAVESNRVIAAFYVSHLTGTGATLLVGDIGDPDSTLHDHLSEQEPFDIIAVGSNASKQTDNRLHALMELARTHGTPNAKFICGVCLNEQTPRGNYAMALVESADIDVDDIDYETFDFNPGTMALHSRRGLRRLAAKSGWDIVDIREPRRTLLHHFVAVPAQA